MKPDNVLVDANQTRNEGEALPFYLRCCYVLVYSFILLAFYLVQSGEPLSKAPRVNIIRSKNKNTQPYTVY